MKTEDVHYMFGEMVQRSEQLFFSSMTERGSDDRLLHLPAIMEALASIVKEMETVRQQGREEGREGKREGEGGRKRRRGEEGGSTYDFLVCE